MFLRNCRRIAPALLVFGALMLSLLFSSCDFNPGWGYNTGFKPEQPIPFSHEKHVGQYKMQCQYCHFQVEKSKHANVPSLNTCMNCHQVVATDSPHIAKLREAYNAGGTIEWVRVHSLPDFTHFNHSAHLKAGVNCKTCHGDVEKMEKVEQVNDLSMGWCVNCHREPEHNAPINCSTCHY